MAVNTPLTTTDITPRNDKGKWLESPANSKPFSSASGRMAAQKRWDAYRQAAVDRVVAEGRGIDPTVKGGADAWGMLLAKQYVSLLDSDKPRMIDAKILGQALGAMPTELDLAQSQDNGAAVTLSLSAAGLGKLLALLGGDNAVVDGEVVE